MRGNTVFCQCQFITHIIQMIKYDSLPCTTVVNSLSLFPCNIFLKTILIISVTQGERCADHSTIKSNHGVLSSLVTDITGCGSMTSPWSIKMTAGQKLSVTLADYGWKSADESSACRPYAYIIEKSLGINQTICAGSERERPVYTSTSDEVLIQIAPYFSRQSHFVLWFDGK